MNVTEDGTEYLQVTARTVERSWEPRRTDDTPEDCRAWYDDALAGELRERLRRLAVPQVEDACGPAWLLRVVMSKPPAVSVNDGARWVRASSGVTRAVMGWYARALMTDRGGQAERNILRGEQ